MPWKARSALQERREFVAEWQKGEESVAELCRRYEVSRQTGYEWIGRFQREGGSGLLERSRAPHHHPQAVAAGVREQVLELRERHGLWGPKKLRAYLEREQPEQDWPAESTIGEWLQAEGLSRRRTRHRHTPRQSAPLAHATEANSVWCCDFKGWFVLGDGRRCDPLTITDAYSRYLLRCRAVEKTDQERVRAVMESVFRENGLPERMRSDNGPPFASPAPGGLSPLAVWWIRLGIEPERIAPGHPEQNGRHERMHLTLKQATADPPAYTWDQQQRRFLEFQTEFNQIRPHEGLEYRRPADLYSPSPRAYPACLPEVVYPEGWLLRTISPGGQIRWRSEYVFISRVVAGEVVGLELVDEDLYEIRFGRVLLGWLDNTSAMFVPDLGFARRGEGRRRGPAAPSSEPPPPQEENPKEERKTTTTLG